jgi:hypothetical protein
MSEPRIIETTGVITLEPGTNFEPITHTVGDTTLKDSGKRQEFSTGAVRDVQENKGRYDLLPFHALERVAKIFEAGSKKYGAENWRKGIPARRFLDSAFRHLSKAAQGQHDEDHLAQAAWNILCLIETQFMVKQGILSAELDDMPNWFTPKA